MNRPVPSSPSLSVSSSSLLTTFVTLSGGERRLFKRLYTALWHYLWPMSEFDAVSVVYTLPWVLNQSDPRITVHQWFALSRLYVLTNGGAVAFNNINKAFDTHERARLTQMIHLDLLLRTTFDPAQPHAVKPSHITRTYVSFTPTGVKYYNDTVKQINERAHIDIYHATTAATDRK